MKKNRKNTIIAITLVGLFFILLLPFPFNARLKLSTESFEYNDCEYIPFDTAWIYRYRTDKHLSRVHKVNFLMYDLLDMVLPFSDHIYSIENDMDENFLYLSSEIIDSGIYCKADYIDTARQKYSEDNFNDYSDICIKYTVNDELMAYLNSLNENSIYVNAEQYEKCYLAAFHEDRIFFLIKGFIVREKNDDGAYYFMKKNSQSSSHEGYLIDSQYNEFFAQWFVDEKNVF